MRFTLLPLLLISTSTLAGPLYPLQEGMSWTYAGENTEQPSATTRILSSHVIQGKRWYKYDEFGDIFWIRNGDLGQEEAWNLAEQEGDPNPDDPLKVVLDFAFPARPGATWYIEGEPVTYKGTQQMEVPAGTFTCHRYEMTFEDDAYSNFCIAEGVGIIYFEFSGEEGDPEIYRLTSYAPGTPEQTHPAAASAASE